MFAGIVFVVAITLKTLL